MTLLPRCHERRRNRPAQPGTAQPGTRRNRGQTTIFLGERGLSLFWAVTVYDVDTCGLTTSDQQRAERGSVHEGIKTNADGSTPIYIGPEAPKGWENNWIKSVPGRAWFPYFRFYGPTEPFFDQSWKLPPIEEINFADLTE